MHSMSIEEALEIHTPDLLEIPGVIGTAMGLCYEKPCIHVYVESRSSYILDMLPRELEGYKVRVIYSGSILALDEL